jgi:hypothetical protein
VFNQGVEQSILMATLALKNDGETSGGGTKKAGGDLNPVWP